MRNMLYINTATDSDLYSMLCSLIHTKESRATYKHLEDRGVSTNETREQLKHRKTHDNKEVNFNISAHESVVVNKY
jgi:hypothetical protein